jgi:hypothetical protein
MKAIFQGSLLDHHHIAIFTAASFIASHIGRSRIHHAYDANVDDMGGLFKTPASSTSMTSAMICCQQLIHGLSF